MDLGSPIAQALSSGSIAAFPLAFAGGVIAGINPCCLALYPAAAGACWSVNDREVKRSSWNGLAFVTGIAVAVTILGLFAAYVGQIVTIGAPVKVAIAMIPIIMGLDRLGWIHLPDLLPPPSFLSRRRSGVGGSFGTGLMLSLILAPCGTPVLASLLSYAAYKKSFLYGGMLLFSYGAGNGIPVLLAGTTAGTFIRKFDGNRYERWMNPLLGSVLLLLGFYLVGKA